MASLVYSFNRILESDLPATSRHPNKLALLKQHGCRIVTQPLHVATLAWNDFLDQYSDAWEHLETTSGMPPDIGPAWAKALVSSHDLPSENIQVLAAWQSQTLKLVWPFMLTRTRRFGLGVNAISPLQNVFCLQSAILTTLPHADACKLIVDKVLDNESKWSTLSVDSVVSESKTDAAWSAALPARHLHVERTVRFAAPYLPIAGTWDEYLASRSTNFRSTIRRRLKRARNDTRIRFQVLTQPGEVDGYFQAMLAIEANTWKNTAGTDIASRQWELKFYRLLAENFAKRGGWEGAVLFVDESPAAHNFGLVQAGTIYGLKHSFDHRYSEFSPGKSLHAILIEDAHARGLKEYDFLGVAEQHKLEWTDHTRSHESVLAYNRGLAPLFLRIARRLNAARVTAASTEQT